MSFSMKPTQFASNTTLNNPKSTLNPNATEFVPLFPTTVILSASGGIGSSVSPNTLLDFDRPKSSVSNNSDEEARQYWSCQLPDDITPDFNDEELRGIANISLDALSLDEVAPAFVISSSTNTSFLLNKPQDFLPNYKESMTSPVSLGARLSSTSALNVNAKAWEAPTSKTNLLLDFVDGILSESPRMVDSNEADPLAFLANQFPGFSCESLARVFFTNQHDLNSTVEMLTQLENQVKGSSNKAANSKPSALNPNAPVFHSRAVHEAQNIMHISSPDGLRRSIDPYEPPDKDIRGLFSPTSSIPSQGSVDLVSGMVNSSLQKSYSWKYINNGSFDMEIGSSKRSDLLDPYTSRVSSFQRKAPSPSAVNRTSVWRGNGQTVETGNVHPELGGDILQHGGMLNAYLQQARPSYSMANNSTAKELEFEVPSYSMVVKPVHLEPIKNQSNTKRGERMIDVHDLHVTDAIHVLSHELNTIRSAARASEQSLPVCICVGSENHNRGDFTPAKLSSVVRRYLLEEERLNYSELQPGLLRVVIC